MPEPGTPVRSLPPGTLGGQTSSIGLGASRPYGRAPIAPQLSAGHILSGAERLAAGSWQLYGWCPPFLGGGLQVHVIGRSFPAHHGGGPAPPSRGGATSAPVLPGDTCPTVLPNLSSGEQSRRSHQCQHPGDSRQCQPHAAHPSPGWTPLQSLLPLPALPCVRSQGGRSCPDPQAGPHPSTQWTDATGRPQAPGSTQNPNHISA